METDFLKNVVLSFVPLLVAVDAVGVLPLYVSLTSALEVRERQRILKQSLITASGLALGFIFVGKAVFRLLGITIGDFMMAGGAILFCLAIIDLLHGEKERRMPDQNMGAVPLGTPLIAGPAVLTTSMVSVGQYGIMPTVISVVVNIALAGLLFSGASTIMRFLGEAGTKALSKVMALLLAAIAVMLMRKGLQQFMG